MADWQPDESHIDKLRALSDPDTQAALSDPDWLQAMAPWLGKLGLLYGVPFNHLVPDARALPPESIRFFFVDRNWIDSLVDGAFSVGKGTSRDELHHVAAHAEIRRQSDASIRMVRATLAGTAAPAASEHERGGPMSGFLLRSAVVSGWPGLEVKAFADREGATKLAPLRIERLAPDVLLAIFDGVAARVEITEPAEALHFGVLDNSGVKQIPLRYLQTSGQAKAGAQIDGRFVTAVLRQDQGGRDTRVLKISGNDGTLNALLAALQASDGLANGKPLSPAGFAVQIIESAEQQVFVSAGADTRRQP